MDKYFILAGFWQESGRILAVFHPIFVVLLKVRGEKYQERRIFK